MGVDALNDIIRANFYAPTRYGLKQLEPAAGASWRTSKANGDNTTDWIDAASHGDPAAWQRLLQYNEDDTRATRALRLNLIDPTITGLDLSLPSHEPEPKLHAPVSDATVDHEA